MVCCLLTLNSTPTEPSKVCKAFSGSEQTGHFFTKYLISPIMSEITETKPARVVVQSLVNAGVKMVFGIPGAKIDALFNELRYHPEIKLIVCRHEQNAAFIAAAIGTLDRYSGVCVATGALVNESGDGAGDCQHGGRSSRSIVDRTSTHVCNEKTHQSMHLMEVFAPIAKKTQTVDHQDQVADIILDAFRAAASYPQGDCRCCPSPRHHQYLHHPTFKAFPSKAFKPPMYGAAPPDLISQLATMIDSAKLPVLLLGMRASDPATVSSIHALLKKHPIPVLETFQAAGCISRDLEHLFFGRLGLFRNQPGDRLLAKSDLIITVGYDPTEYDPASWNVNGNLNIAHIDVKGSDFTYYYQPQLELIGSIGSTLLIP